MVKIVLTVAAVLVILILGPLLWYQNGMVGLAGLIVGAWAAMMIFLIGLIVVRLKRGLSSEEGRFHTQMAQFLSQHPEAEDPSSANFQDHNQDRPRLDEPPFGKDGSS